MAKKKSSRRGSSRSGPRRRNTEPTPPVEPEREIVEITKSYSARPGAQLSDEEAQEIGQELEVLGQSAKPEEVVDLASKSEGALHNKFTWDDTEAARLQRLNEARRLLRSIHCVVIRNGVPENQRVFYSVRHEDKNERRYTRLEVVMSNRSMQEQVVDEARRGLKAWYNKYLQEFKLFGPALANVRLALQYIEDVVVPHDPTPGEDDAAA
jgi:hypothetical protein